MDQEVKNHLAMDVLVNNEKVRCFPHFSAG